MDTAIWKIAEALIVVLFPVNNMKKTITILITILICTSTVLAVDWAINNTEWKKVDSNTFQEVELQPKVLQTVKKDELQTEKGNLETILALDDSVFNEFRKYIQMTQFRIDGKNEKQLIQERLDKISEIEEEINKLK